MMTQEEMAWGVLAISGAPVQDAKQLRAKAVWLVRLANELDSKAQDSTVVCKPEQEKV